MQNHYIIYLDEVGINESSRKKQAWSKKGTTNRIYEAHNIYN